MGQKAQSPRKRASFALIPAFVLAVTALAGGLSAAEAAKRGPVTNLPLPRFVSLKSSEGNARRGPSLSHRIDWVYTRRALPLEVVAEFGHWRRVRDHDGAGGWLHYSLLSGVRTVMVESEMASLRSRPDTASEVVARAERGVVARLGECNPDWCRVAADGQRGWVEKSALWGVGREEIRE
ncbi:SH3 domain-containing protein [Tropicimonas sp.]|uniref:SH3 domain-containing protein n=1 Tax=Tropicimonas sp. TaxID=2067044 RepID=UPI003A841762